MSEHYQTEEYVVDPEGDSDALATPVEGDDEFVTSLDGVSDDVALEPMDDETSAEVADLTDEWNDVTEEDLSTDELIQDGADPLQDIDEISAEPTALDEALILDPDAERDTLDERLAAEEPDIR